MASRPDIFRPNEEINLKAFESHLARYAFAAEFVMNKVVLDVACSWGYGSRFLFDKGVKTVVGGDISAKAIQCAQTYWRRQGTEFIILDAIRLPFANNSFDVVVSMETIEHLERYENYLSECKRVLKEGGTFICSTPYKGYGVLGIRKVYPSHVHEFYPDEFQGLLSRFFTETQLYGQDYWHEGERKAWWKIKFRVAMGIKARIPKLYQIIEFLFRISILRGHYARLSQIGDWDKILTEKYKPTPLIGSSPIPRDIIAVARK
jgi:ubiquinone/menaquinone biosynthesis C-methylase UbiE